MKPLELIWFENISTFTEPVLGLGPIRASLKQFLYTLIGLALVFALMQISLLLIPLAILFIALAYLRPYSQDLETLLIDMIGFFFRKKSIGIGTMEEKEKKKDKGKEGVGAGVERRAEGAVTTTVTTPTTVITATEPVPEPVTEPITIPTILASTTIGTGTGTGTEQKHNLLHYIVPATKNFSLEITEREYIILTGETTIHIEHEQKDAIILITVRKGTVTDILVNRQ